MKLTRTYEVDMIEFNGPDFESFDNRILCLELIRNGLTHAVMFDEEGFVVQAAEKLYKQALIERRVAACLQGQYRYA